MSRWLAVSLLLFLSISSFAQDLITTSYNSPNTFVQYQEITFTCTIKNTGIVPVDKVISGIAYLSMDTIIGSGDLQYAYGSKSKLAAGESGPLNFYGDSNAPAGTYNLIIKLDYYNEVAETDEDNNIFIVKGITITEADVDWKFKYLTIDSSFYFETWYSPGMDTLVSKMGDTITHVNEMLYLDFEIINSGTSAIDGVIYNYFYLSTDSSFDDSDISFGYARFFLDRGVYGGKVGFIVPPVIIPDTSYYIIGTADGDDDFTETEEENNTIITSKLLIGASDIDLSIDTVYSARYDDGMLNAYYDLRNDGSTGVGQYNIHAYLSKDQLIDDSDFYYGNYGMHDQYACPYIAAHYSESAYFYMFNYSSEPTPGNYYLILVVNGEQLVSESNYDNNIFISSEPSVVVPEAPIISIAGAAFIGEFDNIDTTLPLDLSITNTGGEVSGVFSFDVVIQDSTGSAIQELDISPYLNISTGSTETVSTWLWLDSPLPFGRYKVVITSSLAEYISGPFEIELNIDVPTFAITGIVQGEDGTPINHGKLFLYQKHESGKVSFINKTLFTSSNSFNFLTDYHQHTLFYIPNPVTYPQYVPTILGKTVTLQESCFFSLTQDVDTVLEVLKVVPMASGTKSISGNINTPSAAPSSMAMRTSGVQRITELMEEEIEGFPVVLLSPEGEPVKVTTTDASGNYEFTGLPDEVFDLVVALELDKPVMQEPISVDVTENSAVVNVSVGEEILVPQVLFTQSITFDPLAAKTYGDLPFEPAIRTSSGLVVTLVSSNTAVAKIVDNIIQIVGPGSTIITAYQTGNDSFSEAIPIEHELIVNKATQSITFDPLEVKTFGDLSFQPAIQASSGLAVTLISSDTTIAKIVNNKIEIVGAGSAIITAYQTGNDLFGEANPVQHNLVVNKAAQSITLRSISNKTYGDPDFAVEATASSGLPVLLSTSNSKIAKVSEGKIVIMGGGTVTITATQQGNENYMEATPAEHTFEISKLAQSLVMNEIPEKTFRSPSFLLEIETTSLLTLKITSSNRNIASVKDKRVTIHRAGEVDITVELSGNNIYENVTVVRKLIIHKADQGIQFNELPEISFGDEGFSLIASATSFLPVAFTSSDPLVATIDAENFVHIIGPGETTLTATQSGNHNFNSAEPVARLLKVNSVTGIERTYSGVTVYPNPVTDYLILETVHPIETISMTDAKGEEIKNVSVHDNKINMRSCSSGIYFLKIYSNKRSQVIKIIRE